MVDTHRQPSRVFIFVWLVLLLMPAVASAGTFTVTLTNGSSFETRYRPVEAAWDNDVVLINTDRGNAIALLKEDIADVTSSVEESGFGYQVDTTTLFVGWKPAEELPEGEEGAEAGTGAPQSQAFEPAPQNFSIQQFVNPGATGGIDLPVYTGYGPQNPQQ